MPGAGNNRQERHRCQGCGDGAAVLLSSERLLHHKGVGEYSLAAVCCACVAAALLKGVRIVHPSLVCKVTLLNERFRWLEISFTDVSH